MTQWEKLKYPKQNLPFIFGFIAFLRLCTNDKNEWQRYTYEFRKLRSNFVLRNFIYDDFPKSSYKNLLSTKYFLSYFVLRTLAEPPYFPQTSKTYLKGNVWLDLKISHNRNDFISPIECCYSSMQNVITYLTFNILYGVTEHHIRWNSYMVFEHQIRY